MAGWFLGLGAVLSMALPSFARDLENPKCEVVISGVPGYYAKLERQVRGGPVVIESRRHSLGHPLHSGSHPIIEVVSTGSRTIETVTHVTGGTAVASLEALRSNRGNRTGKNPRDEVFFAEGGSVLRTNHPMSDFRNRERGPLAPMPAKFLSTRFLDGLANLSATSGATFLDFACGGGAMVRGLRAEGIAVFGTDVILPPALVETSMESSNYFLCADGVGTGLQGGSFWGILAFYSPYWAFSGLSFRESVELVADLLREHQRILRPGGFLLIGPANLEVIEAAMDMIDGLEVYESSRTRNLWLSSLDYLVLERPTPNGEPTVLDQVFGLRE